MNHSISKYRTFLLLLTPLWAVLCLIPPPPQASTMIDQIGRTVQVPENPRRIISLMPSLTEMVFELGQGDRVIAVTQYSNDPPAAAKLPKIGSYIHLDLERIVAFKPDLCLAYKDGNPKIIVDKLTALGVPCYAFDPQSLEEVMDSITALGTIVQAEEKAAEQVSAMSRRIAAVEKRLKGIQKRPTVFFQIDSAPIISSGAGTFTDKLITRAGGINLAGNSPQYPRYSWENILLMQPEIVIVTSMAGGYDENEIKKIWSKWPQIPAVRNQNIHVVNADLFNRPTAKLVDGLEKLAEIFHPEQGTHATK